ncbi:hypothetical protein AVEN_27357-1 [Araneus ventricosus]|uniref:Uncharacterized protein n=1 Tax=Araneus ventricosus TaxID=182803 RepID=A0A4Y2IPD6_ARAVE|nr:hypothetical protein AVEN_27357-1 [Araneus ventricosus]
MIVRNFQFQAGQPSISISNCSPDELSGSKKDTKSGHSRQVPVFHDNTVLEITFKWCSFLDSDVHEVSFHLKSMMLDSGESRIQVWGRGLGHKNFVSSGRMSNLKAKVNQNSLTSQTLLT